MALTLIERVLKRYPRNGGTYTDMTYTEIQNANFTLDLSRPPLTRIINAGFPDRYIIGYTRIVNDFASTIDDIEPETMNMVVTDEILVPDQNPTALMLARHNGYLYIQAGDKNFLVLKPYRVVINAHDGRDEQMKIILDKFSNICVTLVTAEKEPFPVADHGWLQVLEARAIDRYRNIETPYESYSTIASLVGEFLEIPEDKLPIFPEN